MRNDDRVSCKIATLCVGLSAVIAAGTFGLQTSVKAQASPAERIMAPTGTVVLSPAIERTFDMMQADEQAGLHAPDKPSNVRINRPTIDDATLNAYKHVASLTAAFPNAGSHAPVAGPSTPLLLGPVTAQPISFAGTTEAASGGFYPPDTHGAVGLTQYVQIVNSRIVVYNKTTGAVLLGMSLNSFWGYFTEALFDPQATYDPIYNRWIFTAEAFSETSPPCNTIQKHFIAASQTSDATGPYFLYSFNTVPTGAPCDYFFDFPKLGQDIDAVFITANIFGSGTYLGADMLSFAKAYLYNGSLVTVPRYSGNLGTMVPPIVRDDNRASYFLSAPPGAGFIRLYKLRDSGRGPYQTFSDLGNVTGVAAYGLPANAPQPLTTIQIDTSDNRFCNASSQTANFIYNIHSVDEGLARAGLRWYRINVNSINVNATGDFNVTLTSYDFNASIVVDNAQRSYVSFTSADALKFAEFRGTGKLLTDANLGTSVLLGSSATHFDQLETGSTTTARWGDYSSVSVDPVAHTGTPANGPIVYLTNETIISSTNWGSRIATVGY